MGKLSMLVRALRSIRDFIETKENSVEYAKRIGVELGHDVRLISIKPGMGTFSSEPDQSPRNKQ